LKKIARKGGIKEFLGDEALNLCEICERKEAEFSYQVEGRRIFTCERCLKKIAGNCEWGDYLCPLTKKMFTSESIRIEGEKNDGDPR